MTPIDLFRLIGAAFLLSYSLAFLDMPFGIARRLRERFPNTKLLGCPYCNVVWIAIVLYAGDRNVLLIYHLNTCLAIGGWAMLAYRHTGANHN